MAKRANKRRYFYYICKDCSLDFMVLDKRRRLDGRKGCCPECADNIYVELIKTIWMERPIQTTRKWTEEEDQFVLDSIASGYPRKEIAEELGRTYIAVKRRISKLGRDTEVIIND